MTSPTKPMGIVAGEWDWMRKMPAGTGQSIPFAAIMAMLNGQLGQSRGNVNLPSPGPNAPGGTITNAPAPVNPFGNMMASLPASGWSNPNAQAWTQQALGSPYMQGWGGPSAAVGVPGGPGGPAIPGTTGSAPGSTSGARLASDIQISDQARKMARQFKKAKDASSWDWKDIGMVLGNVALGVATGGASLPGQIASGALSGGLAAQGAHSANKAIGKSTKQIRKLINTNMPQLGYTRVKKGDRRYWVDSQGTKLGPQRVFQVLIDNGILQGSGG